MTACGIVGLGVYLPGEPIELADLYPDGEVPPPRNPVLNPPRRRRRVAPGLRASTMIAAAARSLFERLARPPRIEAVLCNVLLPDIPITGAGAEVCADLELAPRTVLDVHNGGCGAFAFMLELADRLLDDGSGAALLCNVQNTAGQVFSQPSVRLRPHAVAAGDGCAVTLVERDAGSTVLATTVVHDPQSAADMGLRTSDGRLYWEAGKGEVDIHFPAESGGQIIARGNAAVPGAVRAACERAGVSVEDIDLLVTNQPNRVFLRNWRQGLGIPPERHLDTFDELGNLYSASVPVTLGLAAGADRIAAGDLVAVAGFAHAGDFSSAAILRWADGVAVGLDGTARVGEAV